MLAFNRALLLTAAATLTAATAQAQQTWNQASGVNPVGITGAYAGEDSADRAALFTQSAFMAPQGRYGFAMQGFRMSQTTEISGFGDAEFTGTGAVFAGFYGLTNGITVGAALPYMSMGSGDASVDGLGDAQLFGRMRAFRSATGATRMAVDAGVTLPTGDDAMTYDDPTYQLGAAVSHRTNRVSFHVAPDVRLIKDVDMSYDLNLAAAFAVKPKLAVSAELLNAFEGAPSDANADRTRMTDLGAGLRYSGIDNLVVDFGLRMNVSNSFPEGYDVSQNRATVGFSWLF